ncbi:MAG: hypothetical protein D6756_14185 [Cyanobacteria bacterium J083]|nr:MAG: hypothetical protein D6756_14185 [Cyanobacteria bacterium J083]
MTNGQDEETKAKPLNEALTKIQAEILNLAKQYQTDSYSLLEILRSLEAIHRKIRTEMFEPSLPNTRNQLHDFLRDLEETGGWPYIERMKLRDFLQHLETEKEVTD